MLVVKDIGKRYDNREVVKDISLNIRKSQITGLLGPNGAGKTTSFYIIAGLIKPDYGTIHLGKTNITQFAMFERARLGISYLPQESSIFRGLTVYENIMVGLEIRKLTKKMRLHIAEEIMCNFSISHLRDVTAMSLSGGERRRVEIARCIATDPEYILLDEPLAGIDPIAVDDVMNVIIGLKKMGIGILITDHNVKEAFKVIDYAYIVYSGHVLVEGVVEDITRHKDVRKLYLGENF